MMKIYEVTWDDAFVDSSDHNIKKCQKLKPIRTKTIGYLVCETPDGVVLATDIYEKDKKNVKIINLIPWGMIVDYEELCDG
jgi:hypothetical protein